MRLCNTNIKKHNVFATIYMRYTMLMILVSETSMQLRNAKHALVSYAAAAVFAGIATFQLFKFDELALFVQSLVPTISSPNATILTALLVTAEVFATAYFLPLAMSKLARATSFASAVFAPLVWVIIYISSFVYNSQISASHSLQRDMTTDILVAICYGILLVLVLTICVFDHLQKAK